jgi:hypothetical protein
MLARIFRILTGFLIACLAAGLAKVLFAYSPTELSTMPPEIARDRLALVLPIATHTAIFAAPFAVVATAIAEAKQWRDWTFYVMAGIGIALIGFFAQYSSETATQDWSIVTDNYPLVAFLVTGAAGGLAYWLFSGRLAGGSGLSHPRRSGDAGQPDARERASR